MDDIEFDELDLEFDELDLEFDELWERFSLAIYKKMERAFLGSGSGFWDLDKRWKEFSQEIDEQLRKNSLDLQIQWKR